MSDKIKIYDKLIYKVIDDSCKAISSLMSHTEVINFIGFKLSGILRKGGKIFTAGNGGSAAEAMHFAEELIGRFRKDRKGLAAISLAADSTALTCIGNDYGFSYIFSRQISALFTRKDALVLFSTSGNSSNIIVAAREAKKHGGYVVSFLGGDGGEVKNFSDTVLIVDSFDTARVQETHQVLIHILLQIIEGYLFK